MSEPRRAPRTTPLHARVHGVVIRADNKFLNLGDLYKVCVFVPSTARADDRQPTPRALRDADANATLLLPPRPAERVVVLHGARLLAAAAALAATKKAAQPAAQALEGVRRGVDGGDPSRRGARRRDRPACPSRLTTPRIASSACLCILSICSRSAAVGCRRCRCCCCAAASLPPRPQKSPKPPPPKPPPPKPHGDSPGPISRALDLRRAVGPHASSCASASCRLRDLERSSFAAACRRRSRRRQSRRRPFRPSSGRPGGARRPRCRSRRRRRRPPPKPGPPPKMGDGRRTAAAAAAAAAKLRTRRQGGAHVLEFLLGRRVAGVGDPGDTSSPACGTPL